MPGASKHDLPAPRSSFVGREHELIEVSVLSLLDSQRSPTVEGLESSESARLFAERARQRRPRFVLTPQNAQAVAEICGRVEGIPLAIELAASRIGMLPVEQISARFTN